MDSWLNDRCGGSSFIIDMSIPDQEAMCRLRHTLVIYQYWYRLEGWWAGKARPEGEPMKEIEEFIKRIESAKTLLPTTHRDYEWMSGFNQGLEWAIRILNKDKSAY